MAVHNIEIARIFNELADLLEIEGANQFRVRAYRNAAHIIASTPKEVSEMINEGRDLTEIPGIGVSLAGKIRSIVKKGESLQLKKVRRHTPAVLSVLMKLEGLGPKRVKKIYETFHIHTLKDLQQVLEAKKIQELPGFGLKTELLIKKGIANLGSKMQRYPFVQMAGIVQGLEDYLKKCPHVKDMVVAGSYRRRMETVGDLDILVTAKHKTKVIDYFVAYEEVSHVMARGTTRVTVRLRIGAQVDLRVVPLQSYGAALLYFTGSKLHNIALRIIAIQHKYKMNEYGLFKNDKRIAGKTEKEMYVKLGLQYIPPEIRENHGEIEAAKQHKLPELVRLEEIKGDLHCHTNATDGKASLETMVLAAEERGLEYVAITDHSKRLAMVHGLDKARLLQQIKAIDRLNEKMQHIRILKSIEVDILEDGSLDLPNDVLKELDLTVCSVHSKFKLPLKKQTERIIRAMDNPYFNILGHATGRLINKRDPYDVDMEKIMQAAKERHCVLEINSQPYRLDISDLYCHMAKSLGIRFVISTDAHSPRELNFMQYGINQARRGWLTANDVLNTRPLNEFLQLIKR